MGTEGNAPYIGTKNSSSVPRITYFGFSQTETIALTSIQSSLAEVLSKDCSSVFKDYTPPKVEAWFLKRPRWVLSKAKLESVFHCVGTFPRCRERDLSLNRIGWLFLLRNSNCERKFWLLWLLESWEEVGRDVLGLHPRTAASLCFSSFVQGHVPLPTRFFSSVYCWGIGVIAVFLKSFPELAVICKFGLEKNRKNLVPYSTYNKMKSSYAVNKTQDFHWPLNS